MIDNNYLVYIFKFMSKTLKNSNKITIDPQFQPKAGVFFNKDAKMIQLQRRNQQLREQLAIQMKIFDELAIQSQQNRGKTTAIENQNRLLQLEEMMCRQSISKMEDRINLLTPEVEEKKRIVAEAVIEVGQLSQQLQRLLQQDNQNKNLIKRYREQVKMQKNLAKSQKNLNNICQTLRKSEESYQKNIGILKNKLESKKKYLGILLKKQQKALKTQNELQENGSTKKEYKPYNSSSSMNPLKMFHQGQRQNSEKDKAATKGNLKDLNELIRKKNAILSKKK